MGFLCRSVINNIESHAYEVDSGEKKNLNKIFKEICKGNV